MHQSIPVLPSNPPPPPSSRQLRDICPPCQSQGLSLAKLAQPGGTPQKLLTLFFKVKSTFKELCFLYFNMYLYLKAIISKKIARACINCRVSFILYGIIIIMLGFGKKDK